MADQSPLSSNNSLRSYHATSQQHDPDSVPVSSNKLHIHHYLCLVYVLLIVAYAVQTALVSDVAVLCVMMALTFQVGNITSMILKSSIPQSTVIAHFTIGSSLTSFAVLLCAVVITLACFGANVFNILLFASSFLASNPQAAPIIAHDVQIMVKKYIIETSTLLLPRPLQHLMPALTGKSFGDVWDDLMRAHVSVVSMSTFGFAVALSTLVFLGFILCLLIILSLVYILKNTILLIGKEKVPHRSATDSKHLRVFHANGIAFIATMVGSVGLACNGGSTANAVLFLLTTILDFVTLSLIGSALSLSAFFWPCVWFAYISTLLRWGAPHWSFLPQLPILASCIIVCVRVLFICYGFLYFTCLSTPYSLQSEGNDVERGAGDNGSEIGLSES